MRRWIIIGAGIVVALVLLAGAAWLYFWNFSPDRERYPIRGIDVSNHQGDIDWTRVAADDVQFAIIKATEGGDWVDQRFAANLEGARAAGLAAGAYHFFTLCRPGPSRPATS